MGNFLDSILITTRGRLQQVAEADRSKVRLAAAKKRATATPSRFRDALALQGRINIIAEIKKASPSRGMINTDVDVKTVARRYEAGGSVAISVLTEDRFFHGSLTDLRDVCGEVLIPVIRKDFIISEHQIYESAAVGADAVLLIVAALTEAELTYLLQVTNDELGMDALVEVHTADEMKIAAAVGAPIIGINNRDLQSLEVSLDVSRQMIQDRPKGTILVAESGITTYEDIKELKELGFDGFLVGEALMRSDNIETTLNRISGGLHDLR